MQITIKVIMGQNDSVIMLSQTAWHGGILAQLQDFDFFCRDSSYDKVKLFVDDRVWLEYFDQTLKVCNVINVMDWHNRICSLQGASDNLLVLLTTTLQSALLDITDKMQLRWYYDTHYVRYNHYKETMKAELLIETDYNTTHTYVLPDIVSLTSHVQDFIGACARECNLKVTLKTEGEPKLAFEKKTAILTICEKINIEHWEPATKAVPQKIVINSLITLIHISESLCK